MQDDIAALQADVENGKRFVDAKIVCALQRPVHLLKDFAMAYNIMKKLFFTTQTRSRITDDKCPAFNIWTGEFKNKSSEKEATDFVSDIINYLFICLIQFIFLYRFNILKKFIITLENVNVKLILFVVIFQIQLDKWHFI